MEFVEENGENVNHVASSYDQDILPPPPEGEHVPMHHFQPEEHQDEDLVKGDRHLVEDIDVHPHSHCDNLCSPPAITLPTTTIDHLYDVGDTRVTGFKAQLAEDEIEEQDNTMSARYPHHSPGISAGVMNSEIHGVYQSSSLERAYIRNLFVVPDCPIQWVTVYQDKAEVCRFVRPRVSAGEVTEILFKKLSPHIDKDSIRVEVRGPATIQDVSFATRRLTEGENEHARMQNDLRAKLRRELRHHESLISKKNRLEKQRAVLETFTDSLIGPFGNAGDVNAASAVPAAPSGSTPLTSDRNAQTNVTFDRYDPRHMDLMRGFFSLYDEQAEKIEELLMTVREEMEVVEACIRDLEKSIRDIDLRHDEHVSRELTVLLEATESGQIELYLSYVVGNAKWTPFYDVRIYNNDGNLKIVYYGLVQQATGEDWECPQLSLSTSQPGIGGTVPDLGVQRMQFRSIKNLESAMLSPSKSAKSGAIKATRLPKMKSPPPEMRAQPTSSGANARASSLLYTSLASPSHEIGASVDGVGKGAELDGVNYFQNKYDASVSAQATLKASGDSTSPLVSTQFQVPRPPTTIPCDNEPHRVTVGIVDLRPTFEFITAPRKAPYAYLKANMQNTSKFAFLPGLTNVYVDNVFVGKSEMGAVAPHEEFSCKLGADHGIRVNYNPMYKYRELTSSSGKNMVYTFKQLIEVKNSHERPIKLLVLDQLPVSGEDKIKITLLEPIIKHPEKYDKTKPVRINKSNVVEWDLDMQAGENKELILKYSIEYPATEEVAFVDVSP